METRMILVQIVDNMIAATQTHGMRLKEKTASQPPKICATRRTLIMGSEVGG